MKSKRSAEIRKLRRLATLAMNNGHHREHSKLRRQIWELSQKVTGEGENLRTRV